MESGESDAASVYSEHPRAPQARVGAHNVPDRPYASAASSYKPGRPPTTSRPTHSAPPARQGRGNAQHRAPTSELNYLGGSGNDDDGRSVRSQDPRPADDGGDEFGDYLGGQDPQNYNRSPHTQQQQQQRPRSPQSSHQDYSVRAAAFQSLLERLNGNRFWRMRALYIDKLKSRWNALNFISILGTILTAVISLLSVLAVLGVIHPDTSTRSWLTAVEGVIAILWFVAGITASASYLLNNSNLRSQHKARTVYVILANFILLLFYFLFIILSNAKYTNIRVPHESESSSEEEHFEHLDLDKSHHWCSDEKVMAGLSYYMAMIYGSIMIVILMPAQIEAWYAHKAPECASDVADYFATEERYEEKNRQYQPALARRGGYRSGGETFV